MRVAIDGRSLQRQPLAGVGRGVACMLPFLAEAAEIELLTARERPAAGVGLPEHALATPWPHVSSAWLQWSAPRWLRSFDGVFHCPFYGLPFRQPVPMVVTIHDLTFEHRPEWFGTAQRLAFVTQGRWAARTARVVVTDTRTVADDVMATYGVPSDRILIAPYAVDACFRPDRRPDDVLARLGVTEPYVVAVGGSPRRNLEMAVAAWRAVREQRHVALVVVGTDDVPREPGVFGGRLDDESWADVLAGAEALLYPTAYEGFGMPALEAAASGTPVVCARVGSLPEVLGESAHWVTELSASAFATALGALLDDAALATDLRERGLQTAAQHPSWSDAAQVYLAAYARASAG